MRENQITSYNHFISHMEVSGNGVHSNHRNGQYLSFERLTDGTIEKTYREVVGDSFVETRLDDYDMVEEARFFIINDVNGEWWLNFTMSEM